MNPTNDRKDPFGNEAPYQLIVPVENDRGEAEARPQSKPRWSLFGRREPVLSHAQTSVFASEPGTPRGVYGQWAGSAASRSSYASRGGNVSQVNYNQHAHAQAGVPRLLSSQASSARSRNRDYYSRLEANAPPKEHAVVLVYLLVLANVVVFLLEMRENGWVFAPLAENPVIGPTPQVLLTMGAKQASLIVQHGEWWRLFTAFFLHAGVIHLVFNMSALMQLGKELERSAGAVRVGLIYFTSGLMGILWSCLFIPEVIGIGASGAIMGLLGGLLADFLLHWWYMHPDYRCCYGGQILLTTMLALVIGLLPLVDNFSHVGGWVGGLLCSLFFLTGTGPGPKTCLAAFARALPALLALGLLVTIFAIVLDLVYAGKDGNETCPQCNWINCVPTPWWTCDAIYRT
eukprot:g55926.t1